MRTKFGLLGLLNLLLLTGGLGIAQQHEGDDCKFTVHGEPVRATVTGPEDVVKLSHVVEQPDSPIEIVSVDLEGMWLSVSGDQHAERDCAKYKVRNRSDRTIAHFDVELMVGGTGVTGGSIANSSSPLASGQTVEIKACGEAVMVGRREIA